MADTKKQGADLFIVDNSEQEWKVKEYLREWTDIAHTFDIATGYFEIGALLALEGQWQKLDKLRILMGDEVTRRTQRALVAGIEAVGEALDASLEREKEKNDFLSGVPAIVEAMQRRQIECRIYARKKFHAKAYITHSRLAVVGSSALVGSSNFTYPGLTDNVELNIQLRREVELLQEWYERHWDEAEDITPAILKIIERHTREYTPFEVYLKALHEYFRGHEMSVGEWELADPAKGGSRIFKILDTYQQEGYQALMKIAQTHRGAFLCDGVGLGKTFIGLMLIERLVERDRKRVALLVPKSARKPVWGSALKSYLPHMDLEGVFSNLAIFNHTDLSSPGQQSKLDSVKEKADVIVIDEAHHFRNVGSRYQRMFELAEGKTLFMLTATPINNSLFDLQRMIELFSRKESDYFKAAPLGIHSLPAHFRSLEKRLEHDLAVGRAPGDGIEINQLEAEQFLSNDLLFKDLVVQRSRAYVKQSQIQAGAKRTQFPDKLPPQVAYYSVKKTYGKLLSILDKAFAKKSPLFSLAVYNPTNYYKGNKEEIDILVRGRQQQVVALIRTQFLKRFESSVEAFTQSCRRLFEKLLAFIEKNANPKQLGRLGRWKLQQSEPIEFIRAGQRSFFDEQIDLSEVELDDGLDILVSDELLEATPLLSRDEYDVDEIVEQTFFDLNQLIEFLEELKKFEPKHDDKLRALLHQLKKEPVLKKHKILIFTEFKDTAVYLLEQLTANGIEGVAEIDSSTKEDRGRIIRRFAPYYNGSSSAELRQRGVEEIRVLISTDVLSEGLNLQDCTRLINYDLHWNPVRLMQRIGRVDRRMNPDIEQSLLADHPDQKELRGVVAYWNFLPPDELDILLKLYQRVAHKALRISRTFGIEGRKLLKPEDDYEALRDFTQAYEGEKTLTEDLHLEYQRLLEEYRQLQDAGAALQLQRLPLRVFSGKQHPSPGAKAVFFCYALPVIRADLQPEEQQDAAAWSTDAGRTAWYLYDLQTENIEEEPGVIVQLIRSEKETPRQRAVADETLAEVRAKIERHIKNSYLRKVQAPQGVKPVLKAWMEIA
jgi:superfamily II DNA/RNA helicase